MTEETDWIGGQLTAQAVPPDENRWIETYGGSRSYQEFRFGVRNYYRRHFALTDAARGNEKLNPGNGNVSVLCHEPRVALAVLQEMLAPHITANRLMLLLNTRAVAADVDGNVVRAVMVRSDSGAETVLRGHFFLDATELGDLLPITKTEYVTGAESRSATGELHAPETAQPLNMQAITHCFAMGYADGEDHTIEKPVEYDSWREYMPKMTPPWPGRLFSLETTDPISLKTRRRSFNPMDSTDGENLWSYRRIRDRANFKKDVFPSDITLVNWPQNDYWLGNICAVSEEEARQHRARAKQLSLSWLYWLQTAVPREDGKIGWPGLYLCNDIMGTNDGLAKYPYIRESRRIQAEFTVVEAHVGKAQRKIQVNRPSEELKAEVFADSVGIGYYRIDLHPSTGGNNYIDIDSLPFQIPLGALIPRRMENLLPACKNLGVTHITNGCYRLHPVEWNIGESAGALAAYCIEKSESPRAVRNKTALLNDFQQRLENQGVRLAWPDQERPTKI